MLAEPSEIAFSESLDRHASIQKLPLPEFEVEKLEDLQIVVFAAGEVLVDDASHLFRAKQAAFIDGLFGEQIVN